MRVYLAGGISGLSYQDATEWRDMARDILKISGIAAYSPMRDKEFLQESQDLTWDPTMASDPMGSSKAILARDHFDCVSADALLINLLGTTKVSIGTMFELAWAYELRIPTVVVAEADNIHVVHPMAREMIDYRVDTLNQGIRRIKSLLLPGV